MSAKKAERRPAARPQGATREATQTVLDRLRWRIQCSPLTQRALERQLGFSKGYLSQVLRGHVDLKFNHLLSLLEALEVAAGDFFSDVAEDAVPPQRPAAAPDAAPAAPAAARPDRDIGAGLNRLYSFGLSSLEDFEQRLRRCEAALAEARRHGLLDGS